MGAIIKKDLLKGKTALVTGASSGLGADFARHLAALGCNLILVARREDQLRALKDEITVQHPVEIEVVPMDLVVRDAPQVLHDRVKTSGKLVDVLINNAGLGLYGEFLEIPWERERDMLELDILTLVHMTKLFARDMVAHGSGYIMQIASIGAFQPSPTYASYSAAKSFVLYFGEAFNYELRKTNVKCSVLCPGVTQTEFLKVAGQTPTLYQRLTMMDSKVVTRIGIEAMLKGKSSVVTGWFNGLMAFATRFTPRGLAAGLAYRTMTVK